MRGGGHPQYPQLGGTAVETMWADASCGPPTAALKAAIEDDFQGTSTKGERYDKAHATSQRNNRDCQLQQIHIRLFGDSLAMVYGNESSIAKNPDGKEWSAVWPGPIPGQSATENGRSPRRKTT